LFSNDKKWIEIGSHNIPIIQTRSWMPQTASYTHHNQPLSRMFLRTSTTIITIQPSIQGFKVLTQAIMCMPRIWLMPIHHHLTLIQHQSLTKSTKLFINRLNIMFHNWIRVVRFCTNHQIESILFIPPRYVIVNLLICIKLRNSYKILGSNCCRTSAA